MLGKLSTKKMGIIKKEILLCWWKCGEVGASYWHKCKNIKHRIIAQPRNTYCDFGYFASLWTINRKPQTTQSHWRLFRETFKDLHSLHLKQTLSPRIFLFLHSEARDQLSQTQTLSLLCLPHFLIRAAAFKCMNPISSLGVYSMKPSTSVDPSWTKHSY